MVIIPEIRFAEPKEEEELRKILQGYEMDLAGETEDHLIIKDNGQIKAGGKIVEMKRNCFYLQVMGVAIDSKGEGYGGSLLAEMLKTPWKYSKSTGQEERTSYQITTVARGKAVNFYKKHGFKPCDYSKIPSPYDVQCLDCPFVEECNPCPMIIIGGK
ncbi:MAG: GNAT family N-acetyltransferase [Eubacteriales bacterium]